MDKRVIGVIAIILMIIPLFSGCLEDDTVINELPSVEIIYPRSGMTVSSLVMISGTATDPDGDKTIELVEIKIEDGEWIIADGTTKWSFDWTTYNLDEGRYLISVRAWDGIDLFRREG